MAVAHRTLWSEEALTQRLGQDGYEWFRNRMESFLAGCPYCKGKGEIVIPDKTRNEAVLRAGYAPEHANFTTFKRCPRCQNYMDRLEAFTFSYFRTVPLRYREMFFSNLKPNAEKSPRLTIARQQELIDMVKNNPDDSYAFFGPPGTSKTTICTALYADRLWHHCHTVAKKTKWFPVRRISAKTLLDQFTDYAIHKNDPDDPNDFKEPVLPPDLTREKIVYLVKLGIRPRLFLEEIDKIKETESRRTNLFEVIDALYENMGQLVINSNLTPDEFAQSFGGDFARRIGEMCKVVNLFGEKK